MTAARWRCPLCQRPVIVALTEAHDRQFLLDPEPDPDGNQAAFQDLRGIWRTRQPGKGDRPYDFEKPYMPHLATCPKQPDRRPAPPAPPPAPPAPQGRPPETNVIRVDPARWHVKPGPPAPRQEARTQRPPGRHRADPD